MLRCRQIQGGGRRRRVHFYGCNLNCEVCSWLHLEEDRWQTDEERGRKWWRLETGQDTCRSQDKWREGWTHNLSGDTKTWIHLMTVKWEVRGGKESKRSKVGCAQNTSPAHEWDSLVVWVHFWTCRLVCITVCVSVCLCFDSTRHSSSRFSFRAEYTLSIDWAKLIQLKDP